MSQLTDSQSGRAAAQGEGRRAFLMAGWLAATTALFWAPVRGVLAYASENDDASHIFIIPILAAGVLYLDRERVFRRVSFDELAGSVLVALGAAIAVVTWRGQIGAGTGEQLTLYTLALVILWIAGFALFVGRSALYEGRFALLFLFLTVPLPEFLLSRAIYWLQAGSAAVVAVLFDAVDLPYLRSGFVFHTAHLNIEIAQECSGIRSSMAVLILALLAAHIRDDYQERSADRGADDPCDSRRSIVSVRKAAPRRRRCVFSVRARAAGADFVAVGERREEDSERRSGSAKNPMKMRGNRA
jgi:exosortase